MLSRESGELKHSKVLKRAHPPMARFFFKKSVSIYIHLCLKSPMTDDEDKSKIVKFPSLAERDRIRKKQIEEENAWRKDYKARKKAAAEPFFNFGNIPPFIKIITAIFVGIHIIMSFLIDEALRVKLIYMFGFVPANFTNTEAFELIHLLTPITYNLLHGSWTHLGFNVVMGLALGTFCEKMFSTPTTIKFFFLCGAAGALAYFALNPTSSAPVIGASGAISGFFAAALMMLYEQGRFGMLGGKLANKGPWPIILGWTLIMIIIGLIGGGIAWEAHIGGFLSGALLYTFMRKGKLRL